MNKRVLGILSSFLISFVLLNQTTVFAKTKNKNKFYKNIHNSTIRCLNLKTKKLIKYTPKTLNLLSKEFYWAIGKFSKQIDIVEKSIVEKLTDSVYKTRQSKKLGIRQWLNTYSPKKIFIINNKLEGNLKKHWGMPSRNLNNLKGIDVSNWKRNINFKKVKDSGVEVVYMKATEGFIYKDLYLDQNYKNAKRNNLKVGFYHYFKGKGKEEAKYFYECVKDKKNDCRLVLDVEYLYCINKNNLVKECIEFLEEIKRLTGQEAVIYTYTYFAKMNLDERLSKYPLWIAHYNVDTPGENFIWSNWIGFQYSSKGQVPGISGNCDLDEFTKDILLN